MLQHIVLDLGVGCPILKFGHIHIFQRELNPNLFRVNLTLGKQDNRLGCGATGDVIDLTAKLFSLNPRQAAEKLVHDFGLDPDKPPANAIALLLPKRGLTDEQRADVAYCLRVLTDYLDLLHDWRERYKPTSPEEPQDERFVEALHMTDLIEHLTDHIAYGTPQQKADAAARLLSGSFLLMLEERTSRFATAKCA